MPDPTNEIEQTIRTLIRRERLANTAAREVAREIDGFMRRVEDILRRRDPTALKTVRGRRARAEAVIREIEALTRDLSPALERRMRDVLAPVGRDASVRAADDLVATLGVADDDPTPEIAIQATPVTQNRIRSILSTEPFRGKVLTEHVARLGANSTDRMRSQIRMGMIAEEDIPAIVRRVKRAGGILRKDAVALTRTAVTHVSSMGQMETYRANQRVVGEIEYVATLDDRTCFVAGTMVETPDGLKPIESLRTGDMVVSGMGTVRKILGTTSKPASGLVRVRTSAGRSATCTGDHLWLTGDGWRESASLTPGQALVSSDGPDAVTVASVDPVPGNRRVYDIQVEYDHSFIVAGVVVHNSDICLSLDGSVWPVDSPDIVVPGRDTHFSCRSILVSQVMWQELGLTPPPEGERFARATDGSATRVSSATKATQWLKSQPKGRVEGILGKGKAKLFLDGEISLKDLVRSDFSTVPLSELVDG